MWPRRASRFLRSTTVYVLGSETSLNLCHAAHCRRLRNQEWRNHALEAHGTHDQASVGLHQAPHEGLHRRPRKAPARDSSVCGAACSGPTASPISPTFGVLTIQAYAVTVTSLRLQRTHGESYMPITATTGGPIGLSGQATSMRAAVQDEYGSRQVLGPRRRAQAANYSFSARLSSADPHIAVAAGGAQ
jgi:hypothetical protein